MRHLAILVERRWTVYEGAASLITSLLIQKMARSTREDENLFRVVLSNEPMLAEKYLKWSAGWVWRRKPRGIL